MENVIFWTTRMTHGMKELIPSPDLQSIIPRSHTMEGENQLLKVVLSSSHVGYDIRIPPSQNGST